MARLIVSRPGLTARAQADGRFCGTDKEFLIAFRVRCGPMTGCSRRADGKVVPPPLLLRHLVRTCRSDSDRTHPFAPAHLVGTETSETGSRKPVSAPMVSDAASRPMLNLAHCRLGHEGIGHFRPSKARPPQATKRDRG